MIASSLIHTLMVFNSHSRDPADHFKLVNSATIELCSAHPRFITCAVDGEWINVRGGGPERLSDRFRHDDPQSLHALLALLQGQRYDGDDLVDWELEDWVGAGNPCGLRGRTRLPGSDTSPTNLNLTIADLWCVDLFPNIEARIF